MNGGRGLNSCFSAATRSTPIAETTRTDAKKAAPITMRLRLPYALATLSSSAGFPVMRLSLARARERRDITVPIGIPSAVAISS